MISEFLFLSSEINELEALLASIPESHVIERMSFESRLASARKALAAFHHRPCQE